MINTEKMRVNDAQKCFCSHAGKNKNMKIFSWCLYSKTFSQKQQKKADEVREREKLP